MNARFNFDSLRIRLLVLVLLAIVPPVILTVYGAWQERQQAIRIAEENLQRLTQLAASSESRSLEGARQLLSAISDVPDLRRDTATCAAFLRTILRRNEGYVNLGLIQLNGDVSCSAAPNAMPSNLADQEAFKRAVTEGRFAAGDYVVGRGMRRHTINLTYPVLDADGAVQAVAFATLDLKALDKFVSDIVLPKGAVLVTADRNGTVIARRPDPDRWIGTRTTKELFDVMTKVGFGTSEVVGDDGVKRLHAVAPVGTADSAGFTVSIGIPINDVVAPANRARAMELLTLTLIALFALLGAWFVGDVIIMRRVKALVRTADEIAAGNLYARTGIKHGAEEISQLARAVDMMATALQQHEADRNVDKAILFTEKERAQVTLESIADAVITTDKLGNVEYMNPVAEALTGWTSVEAEGQPSTEVFKIINGYTRKPAQNPVELSLQQGHSVELVKDTILLSRDGAEYAVEDSAAPIRNREGEIIGVVLVFHDVSDSRKLAIQLSHQAAHDPLTGLFNRREFERRLELAIRGLDRQPKQHALLFMDLDQFKIVNDTCGHSAGDELLRQITALLHPLLRDSDTLARIGGDEFGALLENCSPESASPIAEKLRQTICDFRFVWRDKVFPIGVSIGLVNFSSSALSLPDLLSAADTACYVAKGAGRNRVHTYRPEDQELSAKHGELKWNDRIQQAFEQDRFRLNTRRIVGAVDGEDVVIDELLLYMADEHGKLIQPMAFIPAAERYNFMPSIDRWVIRTAFARHAATVATLDDANRYLLAINLSGSSLDDTAFLDFVREQFKAAALPYHAICFEIAETTAIANLTRTLHFIDVLKPLGCRFTLDDFGSGMSSFAYLKHLDVDFLKIDGGIVKRLAQDPIERAKVEAVNHIGHVMGVATIAQNVDDDATLERLRKIGIDFAQGAAIHKDAPFYPAP